MSETTQMFRKVFIKSEADLPKEGYYPVHRIGHPDVVVNTSRIDNDLHEVWLNTFDYYLSPIQEEKAQSKPTEQLEFNLLFLRINILKYLTNEEFIILSDWMNSYDPESLDQPEQPEQGRKTMQSSDEYYGLTTTDLREIDQAEEERK